MYQGQHLKRMSGRFEQLREQHRHHNRILALDRGATTEDL